MTTDDYRVRFVQEARALADSLDAALGAGDGDETFRIVHSIKSMAAQVGYEEIASEAHELESELESDRSSDDRKRPSRNRAVTWLTGLRSRLAELAHSYEKASTPAALDPDFDRFEQRLLGEAQRRGERTYRLICSIDPESPLKTARAHLVVSNLETIANVIKTDPVLSETDDTKYHELVVYLTAEVEENELYEAANVDEIDRIQIEELSPQGKPVVASERAFDTTGDFTVSGPYRLEARTLEWLLSQVDEADLVLRRLPPAAGKPAQRLHHLVGSIGDALRSIHIQPLDTLFERLETAAGELAGRVGKQVTVEVVGGSVRVDTRILDAVYEPLLHVIRNAVDHGLEQPDRRVELGKPETGTIRIEGTDRGTALDLRVGDDGRGVDVEALRKVAEKRGVEVDESNIGELLMAPGLTTNESADGLSGRGFGLDIVRQRVASLGGTVDVASEPGRGTTFSFTIPLNLTTASRTVLRDGGRLYSIPSATVERIIPLDVSSLKRDRSGGIWFERTPLYSVRGRMRITDTLPRDGTILLLRCLDRSGWLCVDEVLFERHGGEPGDRVEPIDPSEMI